MHNTPMSSASAPASATAFAGSPSAPSRGRIAAAISGASAESGPSTRMREGPSAAYANERDRRRVQTGHGRQARQFRVRHSLGNEQRGQHQACENISAQPSSLVLAHELEPGHAVSHC